MKLSMQSLIQSAQIPHAYSILFRCISKTPTRVNVVCASTTWCEESSLCCRFLNQPILSPISPLKIFPGSHPADGCRPSTDALVNGRIEWTYIHDRTQSMLCNSWSAARAAGTSRSEKKLQVPALLHATKFI